MCACVCARAPVSVSVSEHVLRCVVSLCKCAVSCSVCCVVCYDAFVCLCPFGEGRGAVCVCAMYLSA